MNMSGVNKFIDITKSSRGPAGGNSGRSTLILFMFEDFEDQSEIIEVDPIISQARHHSVISARERRLGTVNIKSR